MAEQLRTVWWEEDGVGARVCMLDQTLLPREVVVLRLKHEQEVAEAIRVLRVRGAPAIGVTAALGLALAFVRLRDQELTLQESREHLASTVALLGATRPTAVNLFWALDRMQRRAQQVLTAAEGTYAFSELVSVLRKEALAVAAEDAAACLQMGRFGADLIADGDILLTHCNAGALATSGLGSGLAPIYVAAQSGKRVHVFVDETRPILQGARLTAWELQQQGIPLTLITDNMAGHFMRHGGIKGVFAGADRIAANGDVANKIGTYSVAVLAHAHGIPVYVIAPCSTLDLSLASGDTIPIEQRRPEEVTHLGGIPIAPEGVTVANPAFDITPHRYVSAIVTERGVARPPYTETLRALVEKSGCRSGE